ncbi:MAG: S8 family serine peptidase, partial [Planctomycetota bacterium]
HYPSSYDSANILAVAATDSSDRLAWFSNWHPSRVDLGAPGVGIWSTTPGNKYGSKSGTSMATPHVAGACALVMAQDGSLSNSQVQARILDNVDPLSSLSGRVATGGRLNVDKALPGGAVNKPPVVSAGPDQTVQLPSTGPVTVTLNGTVSDDGLPNNTLAKLWTVLTSPPGSTVTFADDKAVSTTVELSAAGSYELQLEADDSALQTADTLIVTVQSPSVNNAPTANAGPDQTLQLPATGPITTTLQGSASDDGKPKNQLITTWRQSSGPNTMTFGNKSDPKSTVTFMDPGTYVLELEADDTALKATDQVQVTVKPRPGGQVQVLAADDFESGGFKGGSGWNGSWSVSGEAKLDKKKGHKSKYAAKLKRSSALMQRQTDLGGVTQATLGFWARAKKFRSSDEFLVQVSTDGSTFTTVKTLTRSDSDDKYHFYEVPLSSVSSTFHLRFDAEMARKGGEVYVDDIVIKGIR